MNSDTRTLVSRGKKAARQRKVLLGMSEEETVSQILTEWTGSKFEVLPPSSGFPSPAKELVWFVRCRTKEDIARTPHVNTAWREKDGPIWLESIALGDTVDWVEIAYGDERANESLNLDYAYFGEDWFKEVFGRRFPLVMERIETYREVIAKSASGKEAHLELKHTGSKGIEIFTLAAKIPLRGSSREWLSGAIGKSVEALKATYSKLVVE